MSHIVRRQHLFLITGLLALGVLTASGALSADKEAGVFFPKQLVEKARENARKDPWAADVQKKFVDAAKPWMKYTDDELWSMMFGHTITRSWMVWSNGHCPSCKKDVPMYTWVMKALDRPWKVQCPHCSEIFPKNDFKKFYDSGLDEHGVFDPKRGDRSLLFNTEHPDPKDPMYMYGVDDGEGYVEGDKRWRFIGAYLIYGQWKEAVLDGIRNLSAAYIVTGDKAYAHKAGVLLDRVADLYPSFDYKTEGLVYEVSGVAGYVSTWHDACEETRELALAYDQVKEAIAEDAELAAFLQNKSEQYKLGTSKATPAEVVANIDQGILQDPLNNYAKIKSNYPRTEIALACIETVLGWPGNKDEVYAIIDPMIEKATAVDGVTGEKGLAAYSSGVIQTLAMFIAQYSRLDPAFMDDIFKRHPRLKETWRFHIDTWCMGEYYPASGDTSWFAQKVDTYAGAPFLEDHGAGASAFSFSLAPSMYTFFYDLYRLTGDPAYVQVLYTANGRKLDGLPYDMFGQDPREFQKSVKAVVDREGSNPKLGCVNKDQWHLAILRSGEGDNSRALWLDYDSGGPHGHADGMNLGLFANGLDLMPDFGYPPVNYGGWGAPRAQWYTVTPAHNTVVIDGKNTVPAAGKTTLWADGDKFKAITASGPELCGISKYDRTISMVDIDDKSFYILDVFRVEGGKRHDKFQHSHFGSITTKGLSMSPAEDYGGVTQMRNFMCDASPKPGWSVDWKIDDHYKLLPKGKDVHFKYTDFTLNAKAYTCEGWVLVNGFNTNDEAWIPRVMVRRDTDAGPLSSTFVSVMEPYEGVSRISEIRRLSLKAGDGKSRSESDVAVEVRLADGSRDLIVSCDSDKKTLTQEDWALQTDARMCFVRRDASGKVHRIAMCKGTFVKIGDVEFRPKDPVEFVEVVWKDGKFLTVKEM